MSRGFLTRHCERNEMERGNPNIS